MTKTKRSPSRSDWRYLVLPLLLLLAASPFGVVAQTVPTPATVPPPPPSPDRLDHSWTAEIKSNQICFHLVERGEDRNYYNNSNHCFQRRDLNELPRAETGAFSLEREAGTLTFRRLFEGGKGTGIYEFASDTDYTATLDRLGYDGFTERELLHFFLSDITTSYIDELGRTYDPNKDELLQLAVFGLDQPTMQQITSDMNEIGYEVSYLDQIVQLRIRLAVSNVC